MANGNGYGKMTAAEKEAMRKRLNKEYEADRKKRAPTVTGSLKEGVKAVGRAVSRGGMASRAAAAEKSRTAKTKKAIEEADK